MVVVIVDVHK